MPPLDKLITFKVPPDLHRRAHAVLDAEAGEALSPLLRKLLLAEIKRREREALDAAREARATSRAPLDLEGGPTKGTP